MCELKLSNSFKALLEEKYTYKFLPRNIISWSTDECVKEIQLEWKTRSLFMKNKFNQ